MKIHLKMCVLLKTMNVIYQFGAELRGLQPVSGYELSNAVDAQILPAAPQDWMAGLLEMKLHRDPFSQQSRVGPADLLDCL